MGLFGIVLTAFAIVLILAGIYRGIAFTSIRYTRELTRYNCMEGDEIELIETIANDKWLPMPWIRLESQLSAQLKFHRAFETDISGGHMFQHHKSLFSLPPYTQIVRKHSFQCLKRGCYRLESVTMTGGDPFGIVRHMATLRTGVELLVFPRPEPPLQEAAYQSGWQGDLEVRRWIVDDPFLTEGVRDYSSGDSMNTIHWKASARTGRLQVHRHGQTADTRLMVCVNFDVTPDMWKAVTDMELIERGIRHAAHICEQAAHQGLLVGFSCNGRTVDGGVLESVRISPAGGREHLTFLLETMARLMIDRTVGFDSFLSEEEPSRLARIDYVIVTAFVNDAMQLQLDRLKQGGCTVSIVPLRHPEKREDAYAKLA